METRQTRKKSYRLVEYNTLKLTMIDPRGLGPDVPILPYFSFDDIVPLIIYPRDIDILGRLVRHVQRNGYNTPRRIWYVRWDHLDAIRSC